MKRGPSHDFISGGGGGGGSKYFGNVGVFAWRVAI